MNRNRSGWFALMIAAALVLIATPAPGGDIKTRMKDRLPAIIELKAAGIIGETRQGFLAFVGSERREAALVEAENQDRQRVYEAIAKQQGTTADVVGQRRALQIAEIAKSGEWLQDADGRWYRK